MIYQTWVNLKNWKRDIIYLIFLSCSYSHHSTLYSKPKQILYFLIKNTKKILWNNWEHILLSTKITCFLKWYINNSYNTFFVWRSTMLYPASKWFTLKTRVYRFYINSLHGLHDDCAWTLNESHLMIDILQNT